MLRDLKNLLPRYSLARLLVAVAFVAVFCAALARPSRGWAQAATSFTFLALLVAVVAALFSRGRSQAFAGGMLVFGAAFFYLFMMGGGNVYQHFPHSLVTWSRDAILGERPPSPDDPSKYATRAAFETAFVTAIEPIREYERKQRAYMEIAYSLIVLLFAIIGGYVGVFFHSRQERPIPKPAHDDSDSRTAQKEPELQPATHN
jgi:hypothetical protein